MKISHSLLSHTAGRMPRMRRLSFLVIFLLPSCRTGASHAPLSAVAENAAPTNVEILAYLEDKPLPIARPGGRPQVIHLEGIEALSVGRDSIRSDVGLWLTEISFIYNTSQARYAVEAVVVHLTIGAQRVFYALRWQRVMAV
jgi:hypothetical protein